MKFEVWITECINKHVLKIIYIPGHTLGHICFYFENEQNKNI